MRIFSRYVFRQAAGAFLLILLSLSGIVWIALALRQLNVVTSQGQDTWMLIRMTTLALPGLMAIIAPFSFLIAALHTLNRLNTDSELIVLTASGATVWTAARPLILLSVMVAMLLAFINHLAQPWSMRLLKDYLVQVRTDQSHLVRTGDFGGPDGSGVELQRIAGELGHHEQPVLAGHLSLDEFAAGPVHFRVDRLDGLVDLGPAGQSCDFVEVQRHGVFLFVGRR